MDYLKGMFKHMEDKKAAGITHSMGSGTGFKMPMTMGGAGMSAIEGAGPDPGGAPSVAAVFVDSGGSSGSVDVSI